jgi:hypothetical protein
VPSSANPPGLAERSSQQWLSHRRVPVRGLACSPSQHTLGLFCLMMVRLPAWSEWMLSPHALHRRRHLGCKACGRTRTSDNGWRNTARPLSPPRCPASTMFPPAATRTCRSSRSCGCALPTWQTRSGHHAGCSWQAQVDCCNTCGLAPLSHGSRHARHTAASYPAWHGAARFMDRGQA